MKRKNKNLFRKKVLKEISKKRVNNYKKDKIINTQLYRFIKRAGYKDIMIFIPLKNEVNIAPLIKLLREKGYNLYVPYMENDSFRLVKYRLPLKKKKFNIKEPKLSNRYIKKIDLAIVPILGIDRNFKRIGYGKGMYDRFYSREGHKIQCTLFLERDIYFSSKSLSNKYDIEADILFTYSIVSI